MSIKKKTYKKLNGRDFEKQLANALKEGTEKTNRNIKSKKRNKNRGNK